MNKEQLEKGNELKENIAKYKEMHAILERRIELLSGSEKVMHKIRFSEHSYYECHVYTDQLVNLLMCSAFRLASHIKDLERQFEQL